MTGIRERVLRAIALNREPGFHLAGNLAEISFDRVASDDAHVVLAPGAHCVDADGQVNLGFVAMLADMALAASVRANVHPATRLATVSLSLQFTGQPLEGPIEASAQFQGFLGSGDARQGLARAKLSGPRGALAIAQGAFVTLAPAPGVVAYPLPRNPRHATPLRESDLSAEERKVLEHAERAIAAGESGFVGRFLGYEPRRTKTGASAVLKNGVHVGNRVGNVQGGLLMGLAATTAIAAMPARWGLSGIHALFVSPGVGAALRARTQVIHQGSTTGVARTEVRNPARRRVLEATTTHWRR